MIWSLSVKVANRVENIRPFFVMQMLARAKQLEAEGRDIIHLEIGEPDFPTPRHVCEAATQALLEKNMTYTSAAGLPELRQAIAGFYGRKYGVELDYRRIFITPGASGALLLALGLVVDPGDGVVLADPGYPCYANFVRLYGGIPMGIPVLEASGLNLNASCLEAHWSSKSAGFIMASPANPTGVVLSSEVVQGLVDFVQSKSGFVVSDEIYQGLEYGTRSCTALECSNDVFVINSFSKYFGMTGWRLGWAVVPEPFVAAAESLSQNIFISAHTLSQWAALAAFDPVNLEELERRRQIFAARRDVLCAGLERLGFLIHARPEGAFYVFVDASGVTADTRTFAANLLEEMGVATTPGVDFGVFQPQKYLRFCYTVSVERINEALDRIARFVSNQRA